MDLIVEKKYRKDGCLLAEITKDKDESTLFRKLYRRDESLWVEHFFKKNTVTFSKHWNRDGKLEAFHSWKPLSKNILGWNGVAVDFNYNYNS